MELPLITFFDAENTATFWQFVFALMYVVMPLLMIWAATVFAGDLLAMLRRVLSFRRRDDRDYEYKIKDYKD